MSLCSRFNLALRITTPAAIVTGEGHEYGDGGCCGGISGCVVVFELCEKGRGVGVDGRMRVVRACIGQEEVEVE